MIYSTRQSRTESLFRKIRNSVMEIEEAMGKLEKLSEEQTEIVHCKDCVKHNQSYGNNGAIDSCPLVLYRGKAQGHEFDYQYCAFAERRTDE